MRIRNPVLAARAVMDKTRHVLLASAGAERFAQAQGLALEGAEYFRTEARLAAISCSSDTSMGVRCAPALDVPPRALSEIISRARRGPQGGRMPSWKIEPNLPGLRGI